MMRFTDVHQHLLWGVDDGPKSLEQMQKMLDRAHKEHIGRLIATPHVAPGMRRIPQERMETALEQARAYCGTQGYGIELHQGAEILYTDLTPLMLQDHKVPTLAGTDFVLVEFFPNERFDRLYEGLDKILHSGFLPILAHAERYRCLTTNIRNAYKLRRELEVCFQVNCSSVIEKKGFFTNRFVERMLNEEMVDIIGTDAHNLTSRPPRMRAAYAALKERCDVNYARMLTCGTLIFPEEGED